MTEATYVYIVDNRVSSAHVLDVIKGIIEHMFTATPNQRKLLFQSSNATPAECLLASMYDAPGDFDRQLKNMKPCITSSDTTTNTAENMTIECLHYCLRIFNACRFKDGVDTVAQGRCPWLLAPVVFVLLTSGETSITTLSCSNTSQQRSLDEAFFSTPFRWDHRVFCAFIKDSSPIHSHSKDKEDVAGSNVGNVDHAAVLAAEKEAAESQQHLSLLCRSTGGDMLIYKVSAAIVAAGQNTDEGTSGASIHVDSHSNQRCLLRPTELRAFAHRLLVDMATGGKGVGVLLRPPESSTAVGGSSSATLTTSTTQNNVVLARLMFTPPHSQQTASSGLTEAWWPLPESFWLDQSIDALPPRQTFPILKIHSPHSTPGTVADSFKTGGMDVTMHPQHQRLEAANVYLSLARELGIHVDTYELAPAVGSPQSVKKSLGLHKNDCCHVSVQGSGQGPRGRTLQDLSEQYHTEGGGGDMGGGGSAAVDQPCAILTARSQVPGSVELVVMPYNYPVLLPLLKRSSDMLKNSNIASSNIGLQDQIWVTQFRKELSVYFLNIPANYYPKLLMLLKNLRLNILLSSIQQSSFDGKIHVTPFKQIQRAIGFAIVEVAEWDASMVVRHRQRQQRRQGLAGAGLGPSSDSALSVTDIALNSSDPGKLLIDLEQNLFEMPTTALLGSWERMRKTLFGGGTMSLTHAMRAFDDCHDGKRRRRNHRSNSSNSSSSSSSGNNSSSSRRRRHGKSSDHVGTMDKHSVGDHHFHDDDDEDDQHAGRDDWFEAAVGGQSMCRVSCMDMGKYIDVLARRESLRDPDAFHLKDEENTVQGIMQRKLAVNFGNRFGGKGYGLEGASEGQGLAMSQQAVAVMEIEAREGVKMSIVTQPGLVGSVGDKGLSARDALVTVTTSDSTEMTSSLSSSSSSSSKSSSSSLIKADGDAGAVRNMLEQVDLVFMDTPLPPKIDDDDTTMDLDDGSTSLGSKRSLSLSTDTLDSLGYTSDPGGSIPTSSSGVDSNTSLGIAASDRKRSRTSMSGGDIDLDGVRDDDNMDVTATGSQVRIRVLPPLVPYRGLTTKRRKKLMQQGQGLGPGQGSSFAGEGNKSEDGIATGGMGGSGATVGLNSSVTVAVMPSTKAVAPHALLSTMDGLGPGLASGGGHGIDTKATTPPNTPPSTPTGIPRSGSGGNASVSVREKSSHVQRPISPPVSETTITPTSSTMSSSSSSPRSIATANLVTSSSESSSTGTNTTTSMSDEGSSEQPIMPLTPPPPPPPEPLPLPTGWQECFSKTHQRVYWFNAQSGARSWTRPTE